MTENAQRAALVETGLRLIHERGFTATGVREIAATAGVPHGSFTNHFRSKEVFGALLLDRYAERLEAVMAATLRDEARPPRERLRAYFDEIERRLEAAAWRVGCLVPDLATEAAAHGEALRLRVCAVIEGQIGAFEAVLSEVLGEGAAGGEARDLAGFVIAAWHGSLLRMKVERSPVALRQFRRSLDRWLDQSRPYDEA